MYIPKIGDSLKILTDDEVRDFAVMNFSVYIKFTRQKVYSKQSGEQNFRKVAESLCLSKIPDEVQKHVEMMQSSYSDNCICHYNIKILNLFDQELQLINTKLIIKNKFSKLLSDFKKFKV